LFATDLIAIVALLYQHCQFLAFYLWELKNQALLIACVAIAIWKDEIGKFNLCNLNSLRLCALA
jgi:hypothetical protein